MLGMRRRGRRAGVTLVELMTVTGIMATLAGQSSGAFMQARNQALGVQCGQQLRQLYLAVQMATDQNDGRLPVAWFFPWNMTATGQLDPTDQYNIVNIVAGRDGSLRRLFVCPAAPQMWQRLGLTYVYNDAIGGQLLDNLPNPSTTWLMMDANVMDQTRFPAPHVGTYNVLFCDGHVKAIPQASIAAIWRPPALPQQQPPAEDEEQ